MLRLIQLWLSNLDDPEVSKLLVEPFQVFDSLNFCRLIRGSAMTYSLRVNALFAGQRLCETPVWPFLHFLFKSKHGIAGHLVPCLKFDSQQSIWKL